MTEICLSNQNPQHDPKPYSLNSVAAKNPSSSVKIHTSEPLVVLAVNPEIPDLWVNKNCQRGSIVYAILPAGVDTLANWCFGEKLITVNPFSSPPVYLSLRLGLDVLPLRDLLKDYPDLVYKVEEDGGVTFFHQGVPIDNHSAVKHLLDKYSLSSIPEGLTPFYIRSPVKAFKYTQKEEGIIVANWEEVRDILAHLARFLELKLDRLSQNSPRNLGGASDKKRFTQAIEQIKTTQLYEKLLAAAVVNLSAKNFSCSVYTVICDKGEKDLISVSIQRHQIEQRQMFLIRIKSDKFSSLEEEVALESKKNRGLCRVGGEIEFQVLEGNFAVIDLRRALEHTELDPSLACQYLTREISPLNKEGRPQLTITQEGDVYAVDFRVSRPKNYNFIYMHLGGRVFVKAVPCFETSVEEGFSASGQNFIDIFMAQSGQINNLSLQVQVMRLTGLCLEDSQQKTLLSLREKLVQALLSAHS